ncbi:F-box/LRR-repeat protein 25-like [Impatiens glandulifera]|uniref:F-box/LRR-repeat protein 25-like n=1 Tax=Impatiens glandulifera TaxID=253017 RepID=UPI001FB07D26|nr:F-box/LRR-repeat protein 25-like [Impatiens glandulifera]
MSRGRKAVQLTKKNDYLSQLPVEILNTITCMLNLKDAVRTSILSKRWRYIWINHTDLKFNHVNILGLEFSLLEKNLVGANTIFVKFVDEIMQQRLKGNDKINSFCLQFELGKCFSRSIDSWISCAVRKGVETIDLDLSKFNFNFPGISSSKQRCKRYNFSLLRTVSEDKGSLKHLRLAFCNFQGRSSSKKFGSLISLELQSVNISSLQLAKVLESCPLLEKLALDACSKLTYLRIGRSTNNTVLKILSLKKCLKLREIDLCADNLVSLELESINITNLQLTEILKSCPLLEELTLHMCSDLNYTRLSDSVKILSSNSFNLMEIYFCANNT